MMRALKILPWVGMLLPLSVTTAASEPLAAAWRSATQLDFSGSWEGFRAAEATATSREGRLGEAILLTSVAPRTATRLETSRASLRALAAEDERDEVDAVARFFLGRIAQVYGEPINLEEAARHYAAVVERHPGHRLAGMAAVRLSIVEILQAPEGERRRAALLAAEERVSQMAATGSRIDLHWVLAEAWWRGPRDAARALAHLLAADELGGSVRTNVQVDQWITIGEFARQLGRLDVARRYFSRAVAEAPRDERADELRGVLAAWEAAGDGGTEGGES